MGRNIGFLAEIFQTRSDEQWRNVKRPCTRNARQEGLQLKPVLFDAHRNRREIKVKKQGFLISPSKHHMTVSEVNAAPSLSAVLLNGSIRRGRPFVVGFLSKRVSLIDVPRARSW